MCFWCMLREGAWPWASPPTDFPLQHDLSFQSAGYDRSPAHWQFVESECQKEFDAGRYSHPFPALLPGMACMPIHVVERKGKLRLVTDQSARPHLLNSLIPKDCHAVPLCGLLQFGYNLCKSHRRAHRRKINIFKCDVKSAYRLVPMHPFWQMLQVTRLPDGRYAVNRNNVFGSGASGHCWWSIMSLILWVARTHFNCQNLLDYVDDVWSDEYAPNMLLYPRYRMLLPRKQVRLLNCFDELDVPHDAPKQTFGGVQPVIGLDVDGNLLTITMPPPSKSDLLLALEDFCRNDNGQICITRTICQCYALAGHVNWALNVFPPLHPGLASLYATLGGSYIPSRRVYINDAIRHDLLWLANRIRASDGIFMLESVAWRADEADLTLYLDACLTHFGFWSTPLFFAFHAPTLPTCADDPIFFHEAFTAVCAIHWACTSGALGVRQIVLYTNNMNTVDMFNSLHARDHYNELLKVVIDLLMRHEVDLWVLNVPEIKKILMINCIYEFGWHSKPPAGTAYP